MSLHCSLEDMYIVLYLCTFISVRFCFSHSRGGNKLHDLAVSGEEERSLIVIQGLTVYNKVCLLLVHLIYI